MKDAERIKCKTKACNNPVLEGKYCENCYKLKKENRDKFLKSAGGVALGIGSLVLTVVFKKPFIKK